MLKRSIVLIYKKYVLEVFMISIGSKGTVIELFPATTVKILQTSHTFLTELLCKN